MLTLPFKLLAILGAAGAVGAVATLAVVGTPPKKPAPEAPPAAESAAVSPPAAPAAPAPERVAPSQPEKAPDEEAQRPRFDIVRVEAGGDVVVAGRAGPGATVDLLVDGKKYDRAIADLGGQFAIVPRPLTPGQHELSLRARTPDGPSLDSRQSVTVIVPDSKAQSAVVAVAEPERPTTLLQAPQAALQPAPRAATPAPAVAAPAASAPAAVSPAAVPAPPAPLPRAPVAVSLVEADEAGRFFAVGKAAAGASVRLYLNNAFLAAAQASAAGDWSFTILRGLTPGRYDVRLDDVEAASGKVLSRAEVPFVLAMRPEPPRPTPPAVAQAPVRPAAPPPAQVQPPAPVPPTAARPAVNPPPVSPPAAQPAVAAPAPLPVSPAAPAEAPARVATAVQPSVSVPLPPSPSAVVIVDVRSETVRRGDSLWRISRRIYGQGVRYTTIFAANTDQIRDPARIYPGQIFVMPKELPAEAPSRAPG